MTYEIRSHTADVAVAATGETLEAVFEAMGDGLAATMCEDWPADGNRFELEVVSESKEALLFDYLDELIYQRDVLDVLPVEHSVSIAAVSEGWRLEGTARGVPLDRINAREIKAVTYSEMHLAQDDDGWKAYVVFDV